MSVCGAILVGGGLGEAQFINAYNYTVVSGNTLVIPKPSVVTGDLLVAWTLGSNDTDGTDDAAFTLRKNVSSGVFGRISTRVINGSEGSTFTFTLNKSTSTFGVILAHLRSANFDVAGNISNASATALAPSITVSKKAKVLAAYGRSAGSNTFTVPTGMAVATEIKTVTGLSAALFVGDFLTGATGGVASAASGGTSRGILFGCVAP